MMVSVIYRKPGADDLIAITPQNNNDDSVISSLCEDREGREVKRSREKLEQSKRNEVKLRERGNNSNRWRNNTDGFGLII